MKAIHTQHFPDGCFAYVLPSFRWDLCLPTGRHVYGVGVDLDGAKAAIEAAHDQYVLAVWRHGRPGFHHSFVVPLGERQR